jgi:succinyl-CoA synthetase beta subunit
MICDTILNGIIQAVQKLGDKVTVFVRLTGTNSDFGRQLLQDILRRIDM